MLQLLEIGDTRAEKYLGILKQNINDPGLEKKARILEHQIENYDFDLACEMLKDIRECIEQEQ